MIWPGRRLRLAQSRWNSRPSPRRRWHASDGKNPRSAPTSGHLPDRSRTLHFLFKRIDSKRGHIRTRNWVKSSGYQKILFFFSFFFFSSRIWFSLALKASRIALISWFVFPHNVSMMAHSSVPMPYFNRNMYSRLRKNKGLEQKVDS